MPILDEPYATEIVPGLWLGNILSAQDREFLDKKPFNIKYIVNVTHNFPNYFKDKKYIKVPIRNEDKTTYSLLKQKLPKIIKFIAYGLSLGDVLVHCKNGRRESATIVTHFLMVTYNISAKEAIKYIKIYRPTVELENIYPIDNLSYHC